MDQRKWRESPDVLQCGDPDEKDAPKGHRGALWAQVSLSLYGLLGTTVLSVRNVVWNTGPTLYVAQTEYVDPEWMGGESQTILTAFSRRDGWSVVLADDPEMWYGYPALSEDASRLVFLGARRQSQGGLTDRGLYVSDVLRDRSGRPQATGPATRVAAIADISMFTVVPLWIGDGRRVVYATKVESETGRPSPHIFITDVETGENRDLTRGFTEGATNPACSPTTGRIAFTGGTVERGRKRWDIYTIGPDGTGLRRLTSPANTEGAYNATPRWVNGGRDVQFWADDRSSRRTIDDGTTVDLHEHFVQSSQ